jgi:hypothetical protein
MADSKKIKNVAVGIQEILKDSASTNLSAKDAEALERARRTLDRTADRVAKKERTGR